MPQIASAKEGREERARIIGEARKVHYDAQAAKRPLTAEERQQIDRILGYYDNTRQGPDGKPLRVKGEEEVLKEQIEALEGDGNRFNRLEQLDAELRSPAAALPAAISAAAAAASTVGGDGSSLAGTMSQKGKRAIKAERAEMQRMRQMAMRAWMLQGTGSSRQEFIDAATTLKMNTFNANLNFAIPQVGQRKEYYRNEFGGKPDRRIFSAFDYDEVRAATGPTQSSVIGTAGAYIVPETMMHSIEIALKAYWDLDGITHIKTSGVGPLVYPQNNDTTIKGHRITDGTQVTPQNITLSALTLQAYLYTSNVVLVPITLMTDTAVPIDALVGRLLGIRVGRILADEMTSGTGGGMPFGIATAAPLGVQALLTTAVSSADLYKLEHSVDPDYRKGPMVKFMMHDQILLNIKLLKSGIGTYLWQNGLASGSPDKIDGFGYIINQSMPSTCSSGVKSMLFGDMSKYITREVETSYKMVRLVERYMDQACVGFICYSMWDGGLNDAGTHPVTALQN